MTAALARYREGDARGAAEALRPLAEAGNTEAQHALGLVLEFGLNQPTEAATWYQRAANVGHLESMNSLGALYYDGRGVQQDLVRAKNLYAAAALKGHATAQYNLALMFGQAKGGPRDNKAMVAWLTRAAESGLDRAQAQLGRLYLEGIGVPADAMVSRMELR